MVDLKRIAHKVVNRCLRVKPGERFQIYCGDPLYWDFCQEVSLAAIETGAYPIISAGSDRISREAMNQTEEYLVEPGSMGLALMDAVDVRLMVCFPTDPSLLSDVPPKKLAASSKAGKEAGLRIQERNRDKTTYRMASFIYPTDAQAREYGLWPDEYSRMIWEAVDVDYEAMQKPGGKVDGCPGRHKGSAHNLSSWDGPDIFTGGPVNPPGRRNIL